MHFLFCSCVCELIYWFKNLLINQPIRNEVNNQSWPRAMYQLYPRYAPVACIPTFGTGWPDFASSSVLFIALFELVVIGRFVYFRLGFSAWKRKPLKNQSIFIHPILDSYFSVHLPIPTDISKRPNLLVNLVSEQTWIPVPSFERRLVDEYWRKHK